MAHVTSDEVAGCSRFRKHNAAACPTMPLLSCLIAQLPSPFADDMLQPHISFTLGQRPNHHICRPSLGSSHSPSSLGSAGLSEHIWFKAHYIQKLDLWLNSHPQSNTIQHMLIVPIGIYQLPQQHFLLEHCSRITPPPYQLPERPKTL